MPGAYESTPGVYRFAEIDVLSAPTEYRLVTDHVGKFNKAIGISGDILVPGFMDFPL